MVLPELYTSPHRDDGSHAALSLLLTLELFTFPNSEGRTDLVVINMSHQIKVKKLSYHRTRTALSLNDFDENLIYGRR